MAQALLFLDVVRWLPIRRTCIVSARRNCRLITLVNCFTDKRSHYSKYWRPFVVASSVSIHWHLVHRAAFTLYEPATEKVKVFLLSFLQPSFPLRCQIPPLKPHVYPLPPPTQQLQTPSDRHRRSVQLPPLLRHRARRIAETAAVCYLPGKPPISIDRDGG